MNDLAHSISDALIRLASLPRVRITNLPTPIEEMLTMTRALDAPLLFVKRDD